MPTDVIHTVGPGGTYPTLQAAADDVARDVVTADEVPRFRVFGGANVGNLTSSVLLNQAGWATDKDHPIVIEGAPGHEPSIAGELDTSRAYLQANGSFFNAGQIQSNQHLVIERMQLDLFASVRLSHNVFGTGGGSFRVRRCLFLYELAPTESQTNEGPSLEWRSPAADCEILNSIFICRYTGGTNSSYQVFIQSVDVPQNIKIRDSVIVTVGGNGGGKTCIYARHSHVVTVQNSYLGVPSNSVFGVKLEANAATVTLGANVATSEVSSPTVALRNIPFDATTFESVTVGSRNLTPAASSPLLDAGADTSADGVVEDFFGNTVPNGAAQDIGAVERAVVTVIQAALGLGGSGGVSMSSTRKRIESLALGGSGSASVESVRKRITSLGFAGLASLSVTQIAKLEAALALGGSGAASLATGPLKVVQTLELGGQGGFSVTLGTLRKVIALAFAGEGGASVAADVLLENGFVQASSRAIFRMKSMTEAAIYYPAGNLAAGRAIRVILEREPVGLLEFSEATLGQSVVIELARDANLGVTEVRENVDLIEVSLVEGKPKVKLRVNSVLLSDPGVYRILATK